MHSFVVGRQSIEWSKNGRIGRAYIRGFYCRSFDFIDYLQFAIVCDLLVQLRFNVLCEEKVIESLPTSTYATRRLYIKHNMKKATAHVHNLCAK